MAGEELIERSRTLWKDRARAVQIQIRDRFRVAVDRHRHWKVELDYSLAIRRRIRKVWGEADSTLSKPRASYRFYRKRVGKVVDGVDESVIVRMLQAVAVPVIGSACHVFMHGLNSIKIYGADKLHQALLQRPKGKPLLTVSNHVAAIDDPFVIASLLPPNIMLDARNLRWALCATDRCFSNPVLSAFFRCVKVLPVSRDDGIYQKVSYSFVEVFVSNSSDALKNIYVTSNYSSVGYKVSFCIQLLGLVEHRDYSSIGYEVSFCIQLYLNPTTVLFGIVLNLQ